MYNTKTAITKTIGDILNLLTDYDIYSYYIGQFNINKLYNSPLRSDDKNPSFAIFKGRNGNLLFKDHGNGESGNALKFIKLFNNINSDENLEKELLRIVKKTNPQKIKNKITISDYKTDIGIARQPFNKTDANFWLKYGIHSKTLKFYDVFSIKYFLCNGTVRGIYKKDNPIYAYKVNNNFKIYRPLSSKYIKWRTNLNNYDIQGLKQLPVSGNLLIITKSLKDVMVLYEMGYNAISASSETTFIPEDILESLKLKWNYILILYDRDKTGMKKARNYCKKYNLNAFFINKKFKSKDISDAVKNNNFLIIKEWLDKTLKCYAAD